MKTTLKIQNLKCGGCEKTIVNQLSELENVLEVSVNQEEASVTFTHVSSGSLDIVTKILSKLGYPVVGEKNNFGKKASSYISCAIGKMYYEN